ncbi:MAG: rod shape-determining protein MreC [Mariprofundales bacterium]
MKPVSLLFIALVTAVGLFGARNLEIGQQLLLWTAPMIDQLQAPARWAHDVSTWMQRQSEIQQQLIRAQQQLHLDAARTGELAYLRRENWELRRLLAITSRTDYQWRVARVTARTPDTPQHGLLLDVEGASIDDAVLSSTGLIGVVTAASANHATVRTLLDGSISVPVTNRQGSLTALVRGDGTVLDVKMIAKQQHPTVDQLLITSGAGGLLPQGIPVARTHRVLPARGSMFTAVEAIPVAHWRTARWLALVHRTTQSDDPYGHSEAPKQP